MICESSTCFVSSLVYKILSWQVLEMESAHDLGIVVLKIKDKDWQFTWQKPYINYCYCWNLGYNPWTTVETAVKWMHKLRPFCDPKYFGRNSQSNYDLRLWSQRNNFGRSMCEASVTANCYCDFMQELCRKLHKNWSYMLNNRALSLHTSVFLHIGNIQTELQSKCGWIPLPTHAIQSKYEYTILDLFPDWKNVCVDIIYPPWKSLLELLPEAYTDSIPTTFSLNHCILAK